MCLAVPALVVTVDGRRALVDVLGNRRTVDISLLDGALPGRYVLVHAGVALQVLDDAEAAATLAALREVSGDE